MAVGAWPEGVAEAQRIPAAAFESEYDLGRFVDVAPELGVDAFGLCGGSIVEDFDGDGHLDIVTSTSDPAGPLHFFRNTGQGGFEDRSAASRLDDQLGGLNCLGADYDNDGDTDVLVLRGAWLHDEGRIRNSLLRNEGGTFLDVTRAAGLAEPACPTQAACFGDFDGDGDLDLYVGNEARPQTPSPHDDYPAQLFWNGGDGTFAEGGAEAGVTNGLYAKGVAAGDCDNDGDLDLYVSNVGPNRLYRNGGDGSFEEVAAELGVVQPDVRSFACWFFDYQNDGWLDLFVAAYKTTLSDVAASYLDLPHGGVPPRLYRNRGEEGGFDDVAEEAGLNRPWLPMGAGFGDLDSDGWLDFYLATGDPGYETLTPNVMLRNDGGKRYQDVTTSGGFGHLQKGHGVSFGDLDNDGDQDVYHQLGGFYPGDGFHNALFLNPGHGNRFLYLDLVGVETNRDAVGARVRVLVHGKGGERAIHRAVGSVSSFGGAPLRQEIGLGAAEAVRELEVVWPTSGVRQLWEDVPLDAWLRVTEGRTEYEVLPLERASFR